MLLRRLAGRHRLVGIFVFELPRRKMAGVGDLRGARELQKHLEKRFGCEANGTSKDGKFTLKTAECLAACGQAPMVQINDDFHEHLTIESLDRILNEIASKSVANTSTNQKKG